MTRLWLVPLLVLACSLAVSAVSVDDEDRYGMDYTDAEVRAWICCLKMLHLRLYGGTCITYACVRAIIGTG